MILKLSGIYCILSLCSATFIQTFDYGRSEAELFNRRDNVSFLGVVEHISGEDRVNEPLSKKLRNKTFR
jgi:hypothetical protein